MAEKESEIIISCPECCATADYETACPNGSNPLAQYLTQVAEDLIHGRIVIKECPRRELNLRPID